VVQLALEGILRGAGLGRVVFALVGANRQQLVGKSALGPGAEALARNFLFTFGGPPEDIFNTLLTQPRPLLLPGAAPAGLPLQRLYAVTGGLPACMAPILAQDRVVGLVYGDHGPAGRSVDQEAFAALCHFAQQVSFAFSAASTRHA
jgi:hypothetical protein